MQDMEQARQERAAEEKKKLKEAHALLALAESLDKVKEVHVEGDPSVTEKYRATRLELANILRRITDQQQ